MNRSIHGSPMTSREPLASVATQKTITELITPQMAQAYLKMNTENRKVSDTTVATYAADMKAGAWYLSHQGIAFDSRGVLVDGQHRLLAILKANTSVHMTVTRGVAPIALGTIDSNKTRGVADNLHMLDGVAGSRLIVSRANVIAAIEGFTGRTKFTLSMARDVYKRHYAGLEWSKRALTNNTLWGAAGVGGALAYCYPKDPEGVEAFTKQLRDGENIARGNPAYGLREYLLANANGTNVQRLLTTNVTLRVLYAAARGESLAVIKSSFYTGAESAGSGTILAAKEFFGTAHAPKNWNDDPEGSISEGQS